MQLRKATAKVTVTCGCHNGTESRDLLPLRKGNAKDNAAQKGYSEGNGDMRLPQRHRIAESAAVVEGLSIFADEYGTERRDTREYGTV